MRAVALDKQGDAAAWTRGAEDPVDMSQDTQSTDQARAETSQPTIRDPGGEVTFILYRSETTASRLPDETLLECARRAGLSPRTPARRETVARAWPNSLRGRRQCG